MSTQQPVTATLVVDKFSQLTTYQSTYLSFAGETHFGIGNYPKLFSSNQKSKVENVILFWYNNSKSREQAHFKVSILSVSGEKLFTREYNLDFDGTGFCNAVFMSRSKLLDPTNGYLVNDKLTLLCEAEKIDRKQEDTIDSLLNELSDSMCANLMASFDDLVLNHSFTLTVGSEGKQYHEIKSILEICLPEFAAMFEHGCEEVKIPDIEPEIFDDILWYAKMGKVMHMDRHALDLLQAADKYQLESLKNKCLEYICEHVNQLKDTDGWKALDSNPKLYRDLFFCLAKKNK